MPEVTPLYQQVNANGSVDFNFPGGLTIDAGTGIPLEPPHAVRWVEQANGALAAELYSYVDRTAPASALFQSITHKQAGIVTAIQDSGVTDGNNFTDGNKYAQLRQYVDDSGSGGSVARLINKYGTAFGTLELDAAPGDASTLTINYQPSGRGVTILDAAGNSDFKAIVNSTYTAATIYGGVGQVISRITYTPRANHALTLLVSALIKHNGTNGTLYSGTYGLELDTVFLAYAGAWSATQNGWVNMLGGCYSWPNGLSAVPHNFDFTIESITAQPALGVSSRSMVLVDHPAA